MNAKTATERVAQIRAEAAACGEDLHRLSDLEVLNRSIEQREGEWIATRDRYMSLLVEQRKHGDTVREATRINLQENINQVVAQVIERQMREMQRLVYAVQYLPNNPSDSHIAKVREVADSVRHMLRILDDAPNAQVWRLDDNAQLVHAARGVVGVLGGRDDIPADEVIRLVKEALEPNGNLRDLFEVADTGTVKPHLRPRQPEFIGADWFDRNSYWAYEPQGDGSRVVAYPVGDDWHLDVYGPAGTLLAYGVVPADRVAALAPALVARVPLWLSRREPAWRRFEDATTAAPQSIAA